MSHDFTASVVRVLVDGKIEGTGFAVGRRLVLTCAHVVADAQDRPAKGITVEPNAAGGTFPARVAEGSWRAPDGEDIVMLELDTDLPPSVAAFPPVPHSGEQGDKCLTFGYPEVGRIDGLWGEGTPIGPVREVGGRRLIQLRSKEITSGFSGAPVYDLRTRTVIGMVTSFVEGREDGRLGETAFATPAETLLGVYPGPGEPAAKATAPTTGARLRARMELEVLLKQWDLILEKLARIERAYMLETDEARRIQYEHLVAETRRQKDELERRMDALERVGGDQHGGA